jgi:hypothetical protein
VAQDPDNLSATATLAAMGILTNDEGLVDAALSEIISSSTEKRLERDAGKEFDHLLSRYHLAQVRQLTPLTTVTLLTSHCPKQHLTSILGSSF